MKKIIGILLCMVFFWCSCEKNDFDSEEENTYKNVEMSEETRVAASGERDFSYSLIRTINESEFESGKNVCVSPMGIYSLMAFLEPGADSDTRRYISSLLLSEGKSDMNSVRDLSIILGRDLPNLDKNVSFRMKDGIWYNPTLTLLDSYKEEIERFGSVAIFDEKPAGERGMELINKWADEATDGMIYRFLSNPLSESCDFFAANAIFFKGKWRSPFKSEANVVMDFNGLKDNPTRAIFMSQEDSFEYSSTDYCHILQLPYGNGNFVMRLLLPREEDGYQEMVNRLSSKDIEDAIETLTSERISVYIPKFEIESEYDVIEILETISPDNIVMGFNNIFSGASVTLNTFIQKSRIEINEEGSTASAVTGAGGMTSPGPATELVFNRPFLYAIYETSTNTVLFIGTVVDL